MNISVTITEAIFINQPPSVVWDFTQDYDKRPVWDKSIIRATVLQETPARIVDIKAKGFLRTKFQYKLEDRPHKTSLVMVDTRSFLIAGGGGSWKYESEKQGTRWTVTNTLVLKKGPLSTLLGPLVKHQLRQNIRAGMKRVKHMLETNNFKLDI